MWTFKLYSSLPKNVFSFSVVVGLFTASLEYRDWRSCGFAVEEVVLVLEEA